MAAERLFSRALIRLSPEAEDEDVAGFLQGLVTNDVAGQLPAWAGLLTAQGYANALAGIALPNDASVGLHRALGFTLVGVYEAVGFKLGDWWDVAWWQRRLPVASTPPPPNALAEIDGDHVAGALAAGSIFLSH